MSEYKFQGGFYMVINNNLMAVNANRMLGINTDAQASSMEKLSSGMRINRAGDDAAGLAISEKMRNQINGLQQASRNSQDGISLIQTAEGALGEVQEMLQRMRELSIQSMNDTYTNSDRDKIDLEVQQLLDEIDGIAIKTEFNEQTLLAGDGATTSGSVLTYDAADGTTIDYSTYTKSELKGALTGLLEEGNDIIAEALTAAKAAAAADTTGAASAVATLETVQNMLSQIESDTNLDLHNIATASGTTSYYSMTLEEKLNFYDSQYGSTDGSDAQTAVAALDPTYDISSYDNITAHADVINTAIDEYYNDAISGSTTFEFQVGANQDQKISVKIEAMGVIALGLDEVDVSSKAGASAALAMIDDAVESISQQRALLGAVQNRLEHTIKNVDNTAENLQSAESNIRDTDMAEEMVELTKYNILSQASQSMLAQANQSPQQVLQLLG